MSKTTPEQRAEAEKQIDDFWAKVADADPRIIAGSLSELLARFLARYQIENDRKEVGEHILAVALEMAKLNNERHDSTLN
jgi:hypothetical protein